VLLCQEMIGYITLCQVNKVTSCYIRLCEVSSGNVRIGQVMSG
jgi:hypothetical protein